MTVILTPVSRATPSRPRTCHGIRGPFAELALFAAASSGDELAQFVRLNTLSIHRKNLKKTTSSIIYKDLSLTRLLQFNSTSANLYNKDSSSTSHQPLSEARLICLQIGVNSSIATRSFWRLYN
ncbi:unnamed protein product [Trichogramma brassicae]|uniref:Uncharacterized protein n=1 Tax=Trichogramma brassicae TaxID=86971 RepID=A0A6H5J3J9_9HYME|nr:unnamed protein product [Trichogramma brassicae]